MGLDIEGFFNESPDGRLLTVYSLHRDSKEMTQKHFFFPLSGITVTEVAGGLKNTHITLRKMKQDNI